MGRRIFWNTGKVPQRRLESQTPIEKAGVKGRKWKYLTMLVAFPSCMYLLYQNFVITVIDHSEKQKEVEEKRVNYSYMNVRKKEFPWGNDPLFTWKGSKAERLISAVC